MSYVDNIFKGNTNDIDEVDDIKLNTHIDTVRKNIKINQDLVDLDMKDRESRTMLSNMIINSREHFQSLRLLSDQLYNQFVDCESLSKNTIPYNYSDCTTSTEIFDKMKTKYERLYLELELNIKEIESLECNIVKLRRNYESIISVL